MKKIVLVAMLFVGAMAQMNAQEESKFRIDFDFGYAVPQSGGGGVAFYLEPKWNIKENMSVGLRLGSAAMIKNVNFSDNNQETEAEIGANGSYLGTYDYYFSNGNSSFVPFVGGGLGYYSVANISFDGNETTGQTDLETSGKLGGMIRGGFNWGKFKMAVDYNLVGKSDLQNFDGDVVGTSKNSYLGVSLGFFLGGGKWGR